MTDTQKKQYTLKITQANKTQLITILYEMLLTYVEEAETAYANEDRDGFREGIRRARGCVNELLCSLHLEYELAVRFLQLYLYVNRELASADVRNVTEPLSHVRKVIEGLHGAYRQLEEMDASGPVMENVQTVYAGLTYGRKDLNENLTDQGANRGFRA